MIIPPQLEQWLLPQSHFRCLVDKSHCLFNEDKEFKMSMLYLAMLSYLDAHPQSRLPELRHVVRWLSERLVSVAPTPRNLLLLAGPDPMCCTLEQVRACVPRVPEIELAIGLFGRGQVAPMYCIMQVMGYEDPSLELMRRLYEKRWQELIEFKIPTQLIARAETESYEVPSNVLKLLAKIKKVHWNNQLKPICHAMRNIYRESSVTRGRCELYNTPAALQLAVYKHCPHQFQSNVNYFFTDFCRIKDGHWVIKRLASL